jgi:hypothetical protein
VDPNEWSDSVRSALVWLGEADPLKSMETARAEDPETNELQIMLDAWGREFGSGEGKGVTLQEVANACNETCQGTTGIEYANRELREAVLLVLPGHQHQRQQVTPAALGYWMRSHTGGWAACGRRSSRSNILRYSLNAASIA